MDDALASVIYKPHPTADLSACHACSFGGNESSIQPDYTKETTL